jgi:hypothetical protein
VARSPQSSIERPARTAEGVVLMLAIALAMLLAAGLKGRQKASRVDKKELARYRRASEVKCRDWMYPFE